MTFFTAEDFITNSSAPQTPHSVAELANQKLQREAKVVYGHEKPSALDISAWGIHREHADTHSALLVCIAPLEKPKCEHIEIVHLALDGRYSARCKKCDKEMKPTGWEVVDEQR